MTQYAMSPVGGKPKPVRRNRRRSQRPIPKTWLKFPSSKAFSIVGRFANKNDLLIECTRCGSQQRSKVFTCRSGVPICQNCLKNKRSTIAQRAGVKFVEAVPGKPNYGRYLLNCGHQVQRQFEMIERMAAGRTGLRCETCHGVKERDEATARGWRLLGDDPEGDPNYRLYRHDACGHQQRIARGNLQTGRFDCAHCGGGWSAKPSFIYVVRLIWDDLTLIKVGFSANPAIRFRQQLDLGPEVTVEFLRQEPIRNGRAAIQLEKEFHRRMAKEHPLSEAPLEGFQGRIKVVSEIYWPEALKEIDQTLSALLRD